jgi:hypothetical protein
MYQVGFGDCFLLSFEYAANKKKHVLIDFGTIGLPDDAASDQLYQVAQDIKGQCAGKLAAVIATHRHQDHISGFDTEGKNPPGAVIRGLKPDLVVQPWTEHPDARRDARTAPADSRTDGQHFLNILDDMQGFAAYASREIAALNKSNGGTHSELGFIGQSNLPNLAAVENLMTMGGENEYLCSGDDTALSGLLGMKVSVLGPPTLEQSAAIKNETRTSPEFWQLQAGFWSAYSAPQSLNGDRERPVPTEEDKGASEIPREARWFVQRLQSAHEEEMCGLVRILDKVMNNTSVILVFEAGGKRLLFPGDAQIENWSYALSQQEYVDLLKDVNLYKVGHHASRNATPRSLWELFDNRTEKATRNRLTTLVSTKSGKFTNVKAHTEVPRETLMAELNTKSNCYTTDGMKKLSFDVSVTFKK